MKLLKKSSLFLYFATTHICLEFMRIILCMVIMLNCFITYSAKLLGVFLCIIYMIQASMIFEMVNIIKMVMKRLQYKYIGTKIKKNQHLSYLHIICFVKHLMKTESVNHI